MTNDKSKTEWRVMAESVPGASHRRAGIPNQDAILQLREWGINSPLILTVSDGHGGNKYFRSHKGSHFAVNTATQLVRKFLKERSGDINPSEIESKAKEWLPQELVGRWRAAVEADLRNKPLSPEELDMLEQKDGPRARRAVETNPALAYGATILAVAVEESFILYIQLGDGDILTVSETGETARPLPDDERLFANETTSLCSDQASQDFRLGFQPLSERGPALILLSTDGYANSFSNEAGFLKVGSDILEMLRADGFDTVNESLRKWLEEASEMGSGDDTTLGIICRMDALKKSAAIELAAPPQSDTQGTGIEGGTQEPAVPPSEPLGEKPPGALASEKNS
jgi:serine/threonine protein phosphatase PrpC